jgi:hypothetical protein
VSLVFSIFESIHGPMRKYDMAIHIGTWQIVWDMAGDVAIDGASGWRGPMAGCYVAQS